MVSVHFTSMFGFERWQRHGHGRLVFESAFSVQVLVGTKDSLELHFRTLAFASAEANW